MGWGQGAKGGWTMPGPGYGPRPRVRFGAIGEGWGLFLEQAGTWVVTGVVVVLCNWALNAAVVSFLGRGFIPRGGGFRLVVFAPKSWFAGILSVALNALLLGGLFRMACRQVRGARVSASDLFGVTDVLPELFLGGAVVGAAVAVSGLVCFPILPFVALGVLMFTFPLIVDARLNGVDAARASWEALKGDWIAATLFHLVAHLIAGLGACLFCCGLLFTMPLYALSVSVLYRDFFLARNPAYEEKPWRPPDPDFA